MNNPDLMQGKAYLLFEMPDGSRIAYLLRPGARLTMETEYSSYDDFSVCATPTDSRIRVQLEGILEHGQMWKGLDSPTPVL